LGGLHDQPAIANVSTRWVCAHGGADFYPVN
jgi:hypothetical protein